MLGGRLLGIYRLKMNRRSIIAALLLTALLPFGVACEKKKPQPSAQPAETASPAKAEDINLTGAGATFPFPLYSKWMAQYHALHPNVQINYQSIGSGGGIRQITARTVDFGATDAPMTQEEASKAPAPLVHIPTTLGAVAVTYNLPEAGKVLRLDPDELADI